MASAELSPAGDRPIAFAVAALLLSLYLLTFSGQFRSIDEYAMYARVESLALGNGLATPQLEFAERHHPVGAIEPGQPVLATLFYLLGKAIPGASTVAAVMLFSALVTALTGGVLFAIVRRAGYSQGIGALTALAWGIGTTAWPYARSFFREPLLGLLWCLAALLCLLWHQTGRRRYIVGCLLVVAAGIAVKISSITAAPVFALALLWDPVQRRLRLSRRSVLLLALGMAGALAAGMVLWRLRYGGTLSMARYTYEFPWGHFLQVVYGLLVSPVKGILFFSPILLAALPGWHALARRSGTLVWLALGLTFMLLYTYGRMTQWHGGSVIWGPRFVVPLLPLLMLPLAAALVDSRRAVRGWVILWIAVGLVFQAAAGTASWSDAVWQLVPAYVNETLTGLDGIPWWSWRLLPRSPALVQVTGWAPRQLDILWLRTLTDGTLAFDRALGAVLAICSLISAGVLARMVARTPDRMAARRALMAVCTGAVILSGGALLARSGRDTNDYSGLSRSDAVRLAEVVTAPRGDEYRLLYVSNDMFTYPWLGLVRGHVLTAWNSPHDEAALREVAQAAAASHADRLWLVLDRVHAQADVNLDAGRHTLAQEAYELDGLWVGGYEAFSYLPQRPMQPVTGKAHWANGLAVERLDVSATSVAAGDALLIDLRLTTDRPVNDDLVLFVHLAPADGPVLAGRDGQPGYGGAPTSGWVPGRSLRERRAVLVPADTPAGRYTLMAGWLGADGEPIPLDGAAPGETQAEFGAIEVTSEP